MSSWPILACSSWISFSFDRSGDSLVNTSAAFTRNSFFQSLICLGVSSYSFDNSFRVF